MQAAVALACHGNRYWPSPVPLSGTGEKKSGGGGGGRLYWRVQGSTSSPTGIGSRRRVVCGVVEF